jgi:hypothetical protein
MAGGAGQFFKMNRRDAAMFGFGSAETTGLGRFGRVRQMASFAREGFAVAFGFDAAGDPVVVAITMAIDTL